MKNKNHYPALLALCMLIIFIYSCRKEFLTDTKLNPKVEWARNYFKTSLLIKEGNIIDPGMYIKDGLQANLLSKKKENIKIPIWQKAMEGKNKLYDFVEVPLKYTTKVTPMLYPHEDGVNTSEAVNEDLLKASLDRLIIYKDKNGKINQRIISFIPTEQYLTRQKGDISHNRINKLDKDFEGTLIYRKWNGEFLFALLIKDGKAIKKLSFDNKIKVSKTAFRREECVDIDLYEWFQDCDYYGDDPNPVWCGEPYREFVGTYRMCTEGGNPCEDPENFNTAECGRDDNGGCTNCNNEIPPPPAPAPEGDGCTSAKATAANKTNTMTAGNNSIAAAVSSVIASSNNDIEAAFRIDDNAGVITASPPVEEEELLASTSTNTNTIAIGHDHPADGFPQPSPWDFYQAGLLAIQSNGKLATNYTFSPSASYAIVVNNTALFYQFLTNYPMSTTLAKDQNGNYTGDFKTGNGTLGSQIQAWGQEAFEADPRSNGTAVERIAAEISANEYSTVRLMSLTMGAAILLKQDSNGNWKALHFTKQTTNGVTSYTVTPCN